MAFDLLQAVDWNLWATPAKTNSINLPTNEAERIAVLVLNLNRHNSNPKAKHAKAINKIIRMALREIEQAVLTAEQDIDYEKTE